MENTKDSKSKKEPRFSRFFYNGVTYFGVALALSIFVCELFLFAMDFFKSGESTNAYSGIITYIVLPVFLVIGLLLIPLGAIWKRNKISKGAAEGRPTRFYINPAIPSHRNALFVFIIGTSIFLIMTGIGSYKAFHYTESVQFCGVTCHSVMKPEYTTYMHSPHARVKCVECHIGEGADWYVRSKMSGLRQVYHTIKGDWQRPIPTPIENLRPAKETCERCHWPGKKYGSFEMKKTYYPVDEGYDYNKWLMTMMVHVGRNEGEDSGIHAHMYADNDIYFAAEDKRLQNITWVKSIDKEGKETVFTMPGSKWENEAPVAEEVHHMDCMDCHNRPSHHYYPPNTLVNQAMRSQEIDSDLPEIKSISMQLLSGEYDTEEDAVNKIRQGMNEFYQNKLRTDFDQYLQEINSATEAVIKIYQHNMFPEMKVRWDAYPDNIGHLSSPGCFRCHDGQHTSSQGQVISRDCNICHKIVEQGPPGNLEQNINGLE
ncbi:MAG: NapC/NirT family cytochrome c, partial [Candidatus Omnitrophica bacterium]|nr:NapC/NirT family cytochrome c [Candidatus Omnitrophota bacterium]